MLGRYLVYPDMHLRAYTATVQAGLASQSTLWPLAISGDFPIFCLRINDDGDLGIAREALRAQEYLRARGITADLVIINERASSYAQDMQHALDSMCENLRLRGLSDGPRQHIFSVRRDLMEAETWSTLLSASRAVFHARNGTISDQIARANSLYSTPPVKGSDSNVPLLAAPLQPADAVDAEIVGDGQRSIRSLIEAQSRRRQAATGGESRIPLDDETERTLRDAGYGYDDVLPEGTHLAVRRTANLHTGGTLEDVTGILHPRLGEAAVRAARALGIPVVGLDLLVPAADQPDYVFIEANERVGLANHQP
eukprot:gene49447-60535_t